ncbi:MAG: glycosyltransferase family 39 protein, partial [Chloroflexi bacterium]|nr:glycosyltransferase family 39 protein [Chloroflexota bacterium]
MAAQRLTRPLTPFLCMKNSHFFYIGGSALLLPVLIVIVPWYPWQLSAGLLLIAFLPGYALLLVLWPQPGETSPGGLERWLIAGPISYSLTITLLLVMVFARLPLTIFSVAAGLSGLTLLFTLIAWRFPPPAPDSPQTYHPLSTTCGRHHWWQAIHYPLSTIYYPPSSILLLLLAAFFRMVNIHYSDYQGDEADILLRAVSLVYGQIEAILTHSKGPGEILLLNAIGALTGRFDEQTARLPFALAGTFSVGLMAWLGQQLFNRRVGLVVGLLAAIDGVFVSYARTAQYQSVVLWLTLAAICCFYRFYQGEGQSRCWHGLGAFLLAASFLFHFETVLLLPVIVYLTLAPAEMRGRGD